MTKRILALGVISIAVVFAQNAGRGGRGGAPAAPAEPGTAKERQRWAYDVKPVPNYAPPKTPWGDPDLQGIWPINHLIAVPLTRPTRPLLYGDRLYRTDQEFAPLTARARGTGPIPDRDYPDRLMRQLSLIVDPKDGQFPELTEYGKKLQAEMKSSYKPGQTVFDAIEDFSAWDRCITRGMPVSMEPRNYNNGIRIMQSPGYVVILLEMAHEARVIPTDGRPVLDGAITQYLGESPGRWEGNALVVETTNFNGQPAMTNAGVPGSPPLTPNTENMRFIERFTRTDNDTIEYQMRVENPEVLATGSWSAAFPMKLDNDYLMFEYACHEGNTAIRNYIETSRYERAQKAGK